MKKYELKANCPQCGCSAVSHLTKEEIEKRFGDVPNVELDCKECMDKFKADIKEACPEYAKECKLD